MQNAPKVSIPSWDILMHIWDVGDGEDCGTTSKSRNWESRKRDYGPLTTDHFGKGGKLKR
jgi:hypothetical protein